MAFDTVALTIGLLSAFIVVVALAAQIRYSRYSKRVLKRQQRLKRADKLLDALAGTLRATANPDAAPATSLEPETDTLMLVFTDIESSTTAAAESPRAMLLVQETHDRVMRQGIQRFAGYEIHTQGDAFEIAFATAVSATQFCLWTQDQLMNYDWPKEVLSVPQFAAVADEDTEDVIFRGPRVRMGVHAAPPGTWRKGTHGYTHHTVFGGEGVDLIAAVSDAGHGGQVVLTKDAADALIPRIHKVDALLESIGTFRVRADDDDAVGVSLELFDCQPLPTPKRPRRVFSKHLRRIEYVAPGRSLAVIPPPPALRRDSTDEAFIVVVVAEEGTGDDPELAGALKAVLAQQAQLAGGYLASPDACSEGGAVVIFRTDYGAAARFLAVLPVVLAWWEWPEGARKRVVVEGTAPVPTVRVKVAMHVSSDVFEETLSAEALAAKRSASRAETLARARASRERAGKNGIERAGSVLRRGGKLVINAVELTGREAARLPARMLGKQDSERGLRLGSSGRDAQAATLDDLSEYTEMTEVHGSGVDRARAVAAAAHPGQCIMTLSAFTNVQSAARMPAGAFPVSLGRHAITREDLRAYEESVAREKKKTSASEKHGGSRGRETSHGEELYELVSTFLGMQSSTPRLKTAKALTPGYRQSPDPSRAVAVCFVSLSAPDRESETTKRALETASAVLRVSLASHRGYECKQPEPNKFTLAFADFDDAVSFTGDVHLKLLAADWEEELLQKRGCEPRFDPETGAMVWRGLHARCGVAYGVGSTRKPLNTGRADYFGAIPNLAARVCAVARYGQTLIEPTEELARVRWPEKSFDSVQELGSAEPPLGNEDASPSDARRSRTRIKHRSLVVNDFARSPENDRRASMDYSGVGGALREDASGSVWSTLEESDRDAYSLVSGCVAGAFEPRKWVDGECVAWDDANAGETKKSGSAMVIDVLGQFDLRGVSRRATLAQALPASLRAARSKTFEPPEGLAVAARDAAVGAVSIASRDAHLHYDKKGLGKSTARGFARSRSMTKSGSDRGRSSGALGALVRLLSPLLSPASGEETLERGGARRSLRAPRAVKPRSVHSVTVAASDVALDAAESGRAAPRGDESSADSGFPTLAPPRAAARLTAGLRGLDKFRKAGKLIVVSNRFEGAMRARLKRNGQDDWGFAGDLENMPTAESERAAEDAAAARIGSGKDVDVFSNETRDSAGERLESPVPSLEKAPEAATGARANATTEPAA